MHREGGDKSFGGKETSLGEKLLSLKLIAQVVSHALVKEHFILKKKMENY